MSDQVWEDFDALPAEAKRQAADFIASLKQRYARREEQASRIELEREPFIGMWKDREALSDSVDWVRETRRREWGQGNG